MAEVVVAAGGSVATHDVFAVYFCRDSYMLTNGETKDVILARKSEAIAGFTHEVEVNECKKETQTSQCLAKQRFFP